MPVPLTISPYRCRGQGFSALRDGWGQETVVLQGEDTVDQVKTVLLRVIVRKAVFSELIAMIASPVSRVVLDGNAAGKRCAGG